MEKQLMQLISFVRNPLDEKTHCYEVYEFADQRKDTVVGHFPPPLLFLFKKKQKEIKCLTNACVQLM